MGWLRVDDGFMQHPKIMALTDSELRVWMRILCFSAANRRHREGQITRPDRREIPGLTQAKIARYLDLRLLEETDAEGTLKVHDFHTYNPTDKTATERKRRQRHKETHRDIDRDTDRDEPSDNDRENHRALRVRARSRTRTPLLTTAAGSTQPDNLPAAPEDEWHTLQIDLTEAGWQPWQLDQAAADPDRAKAALDRGYNEASNNPGGYAWTLFASDDQLERKYENTSRRENGRRITGCRMTSTGGHARDPLGTDNPPQGWPYEQPTNAEITEARAGTNGHRKTPLDRALALVPVTLWDYDPVALGHELDQLGVTDAAERRSVGAAVEAERLVRGVQIEEGAA